MFEKGKSILIRESLLKASFLMAAWEEEHKLSPDEILSRLFICQRKRFIGGSIHLCFISEAATTLRNSRIAEVTANLETIDFEIRPTDALFFLDDNAGSKYFILKNCILIKEMKMTHLSDYRKTRTNFNLRDHTLKIPEDMIEDVLHKLETRHVPESRRPHALPLEWLKKPLSRQELNNLYKQAYGTNIEDHSKTSWIDTSTGHDWQRFLSQMLPEDEVRDFDGDFASGVALVRNNRCVDYITMTHISRSRPNVNPPKDGDFECPSWL